MRMPRSALAAWAVALGAALASQAVRAAEAGTDADAGAGELRLRWDARVASDRGPLALAHALAPDIAEPAPGAWVAEAGWRQTLRTRLGTQAWSLGVDALAWHTRPQGDAPDRSGRSQARLNEFYLTTDLGAWGLAAGRKVVGWDVGQGFRPNDVVQQEARRTLLAATPEGRPLLQLEHFGSDTAGTLVWVNPQQLNAAPDESRRADESALAARGYWRVGAADWHGFARLGRRTRGSLGAAVAWVAGDELELHASWRALQRHEGWRAPALAAAEPRAANPWQVQQRGGTTQWLVGLSWTGASQQGLLVEAWHDGTALPDRAWDSWTARNRALPGSGAPARAIAGNLAWQATPLDSPNLRRDNLFVRGSWQPGPWLATLDLLWTPADRGRAITAGLQWQGDQVRLNAAWRVYGGPADSVFAQLPQRATGVVAATWAF